MKKWAKPDDLLLAFSQDKPLREGYTQAAMPS